MAKTDNVKQPFYKNIWIWFVVTVVAAFGVTFFVMDDSAELEALENNNTTLQEENKALEEKLNLLEDENSSLEETVLTLEEENSNLVSDNELLYSDITYLVEYVTELETALNEAYEIIDSYEAAN
ncbi:hypothetical protein AQ616_02795 [Oceanobacillus sp. E9]|uniref:bZIP transcription factor n=1 Tax=Oceanobacillus TaxID=182709 RepID=UPI00084EBBE6|nr:MULTISPECIES: bZIP transcription factor [Oceanobacillus]OEH56464.1 hypothetical protein AQ616_02795 [Oceanobacillus sp. E9]